MIATSLHLVLLIAVVSAASPLSSGDELSVLLKLRASLGIRARYWPRRADPCSAWAGVTCRSGHVTSLRLAGLRRTHQGQNHPSFSVPGLRKLTRLAALNASGFPLPGPLPADLLHASLAVLDLRSASVTGAIPSSFAALSNLTYIDLSSNFLSGPIPPSLSSLTKLKTLNFSNNNLTGSVPAQLANLSSLESLDLSLNSLLGSLPTALFTNRSKLRTVSLTHNNFSGALPASLWSLTEIQFLDVSHNSLTGVLPEVVPANATGAVFNLSSNLYYGSISSDFRTVFQRFNSVDISNNYFQGTIPESGDHRGGIASFDTNCFNNARNQRSPIDCEEFYSKRDLPCNGSVTPASSFSGRKSIQVWKYILAGVLGGLFFIIIVLLVLVRCLMKHRVRKGLGDGNGNPAEGGPPPPPEFTVNLLAVGEVFTYEQLVQATSDFCSLNLIKQGHSGDLYHGVLDGGVAVVVKRIDIRVIRREAYMAELSLFAEASQRLVPFLGHCLEGENEKFLVYKYMPHNDLSNALCRKPVQGEDERQSLDWITRLKIATGVAEALCFLHHECAPPLVHRDVQASSILLDDKFEVRLGSLSEVCIQEGDDHQSVISRFLRLSQTSEQGVSGSAAATCSYDIYCFGKVLLELVTGKLGLSGSNGAATKEWLDHTLSCIDFYGKEIIIKIMDPSLVVDEDHLEEVWAMAIVAKTCLNSRPSKRPLARHILKALENPLKVVREENRSSFARLRTLSSRGSWHGAFFGSRHRSSSDTSASGPPRDDRSSKHSVTAKSQGSGGDHSFSHRKPSSEIFPEPFSVVLGFEG